MESWKSVFYTHTELRKGRDKVFRKLRGHNFVKFGNHCCKTWGNTWICRRSCCHGLYTAKNFIYLLQDKHIIANFNFVFRVSGCELVGFMLVGMSQTKCRTIISTQFEGAFPNDTLLFHSEPFLKVQVCSASVTRCMVWAYPRV